ncbi:MAG: beta-lactamase family protein [Thermomicrobiales bacterium]|nr:beta-lactamase family protein [Thermomicrobiales bacterium]
MMDLQSRLDALVAEFDVPGAAVAVIDGGDVALASAGVANVETGQAVTDDTVFAIGSITKVFTASLIMQLVEAGTIDLDRPVKHYLPDLELATDGQTAGVTVRHLLTHTSGIAGDHIVETGPGSEGLKRYVESLRDIPVLHEPGNGFSYSNAAVILAGYLLEQHYGAPWPDLVRERIIEPLGQHSMVAFPQWAGDRPVVSPHRRGADGRPERGDMWLEFAAGASAGFTPYANAADVVRFAQWHLRNGQGQNGQQLLSSASVAAMQHPQVSSLPSGALDNTGWGIGWALHQFGPERGLGHNGGTSAMLRVLPDRDFAVAVLTNISGGVRMGGALTGELILDRFGIAPAPLPSFSNDASKQARDRCAGVYRHLEYSVTIESPEDGLILTTGSAGERVELHPVGDGAYVGQFADRGWSRVGFVGQNDREQPDYVHTGLRAYRRVS